ncbi:hypothetical protein HTS88_05695 [Pseudarthrobacter oxydans]|nr:hypothetical protein [Pseudarthrobacter oxydans]NSX35899.1 hypothetical protein [Pseudarthrobacter oxydans]
MSCGPGGVQEGTAEQILHGDSYDGAESRGFLELLQCGRGSGDFDDAFV